MILVCPWPPKECNRNFQRRKHWRSYQGVVKQYRHDCWVLALEAKARGKITRIEFHPPDLRRRDDDGMISAFKPGRDGIADAVRIDDFHFRPAYVFREPDRPHGKIIVTIEEATT